MCNVAKLREWIENGNKIAVFCAGQNGYNFYKILKLLHIKIDCVVDNNKDKWNQKVFDAEVVCREPEFLRRKNEYITFICIGPKRYEEIRIQAARLEIACIGDVNFILKDIICNYTDIYFQLLLELPYGKNSEFFDDLPYTAMDLPETKRAIPTHEKIAIYTSVFGEYDYIREPRYSSDYIDYYLVSEYKPDSLETYHWLNAEEYLPQGMNDPVMKNRYVKMHPHILFPAYKYSIYVDGNVEILKDISAFLQKSKTGISVFLHPWRYDIYMEALAVVNCKKANGEEVYRQMQAYKNEMMPANLGLPEMRVIAREHNNPYCIKIMEAWWKEFSMRSKRDQLSFMYTVWKNGLSLADLFILGADMRKYDGIKIHEHR